MDLQIKQRERERVVILDLKGSLVPGQGNLALLQELLRLLDSCQHQVIVNLKEVSKIDETGLDALTFCGRRFRDEGGRLVVLDPGARTHQTPKLGVFSEAYRQEIDAVNSFFPDRFVPRYDILEFVNKQKTTDRKTRCVETRWWGPGSNAERRIPLTNEI